MKNKGMEEWQRLKQDFESETSRYHDLGVETYFVTRQGTMGREKAFTTPNHAILLYQYFGNATEENHPDLENPELSVFAVVSGSQTELFRKMATRAGSLLSGELRVTLLQAVVEKFLDKDKPGKPVHSLNHDPLAAWLMFILTITATIQPNRMDGTALRVDPFSASLTAMDFILASKKEASQNREISEQSKMATSTDKPWDTIKVWIWSFFMKGKRKFIALPLLVIFIFIISFHEYKEKFSKGIEALGDTFNHKEAIPKDEYDVMNEWVAQIWCFDDNTKAKEGYENFVKVYKDTQHGTWDKDIFLVRNYEEERSWCIVIDMDYDKSTRDEMQSRIDQLKEYSNKSRVLQNTLGNWLQNYSVTFYDKTVFEKTYGKIKNYKEKDFERGKQDDVQEQPTRSQPLEKAARPLLKTQPTIVEETIINNYNIQNADPQRSEAVNDGKRRAGSKPGSPSPLIPDQSHASNTDSLSSRSPATSPGEAAKVISNTDVWRESSPMVPTGKSEE